MVVRAVIAAAVVPGVAPVVTIPVVPVVPVVPASSVVVVHGFPLLLVLLLLPLLVVDEVIKDGGLRKEGDSTVTFQSFNCGSADPMAFGFPKAICQS